MRTVVSHVTWLLVLPAIALAGPIYTWQDESGQVHYSDRPLAGEEQSQQMNMETGISGGTGEQPSSQYSIRNQIEYFDRKREQQRQLWLEERRLRQEARAQELEEQRLQYERERRDYDKPETVIINQNPYYRRGYRRHDRYPRGVQVSPYNPYSLQYQHTGDHHRFNLNIGDPYPSYPLNFWKY